MKIPVETVQQVYNSQYLLELNMVWDLTWKHWLEAQLLELNDNLYPIILLQGFKNNLSHTSIYLSNFLM